VRASTASEPPAQATAAKVPSSAGKLVGVTKVARTKADLAEALGALKGTSALVMTMGALHEGHLALVRAAKKAADNVVVSIFVNPLQFGPGEDYEAYPRDLEADLAFLEAVGVQAVYAPEAEDVYPRDPLVRIDPGPMAAVLEGKTRPTHFAGVLQVVHKVLNLVRPDIAFFGQKDAQQLALIRTMAADLDMPVEIRAVPIERDVDGLALSSRNSYLSPTERIEALALNQALAVGADAAQRGLSPKEVRDVAERHLREAPGVKIDYLALVDPETFAAIDGEAFFAGGAAGTSPSEGAATMPASGGKSFPASGATMPAGDAETMSAGDAETVPATGAAPVHGRGLLAVAAWVGPTRLIDNMEVELRG